MITSNLFTSKMLTAAATALVLSTQAITFAGNAAAHDHNRAYGGDYTRYGYVYRDYGEGPRATDRRYFDRGAYNYGNGVERGDRRRFDREPQYVERRKKDHTGRNIAIGIGAFMLGAIIASEAGRR